MGERCTETIGHVGPNFGHLPLSQLHLIKHFPELTIGVIAQLVGDDGPGAGDEQQLAALRQVAHLIRRE